MPPSKQQRWYPTQGQLGKRDDKGTLTPDTESLERSFRQLLSQHYDLRDQVDALTAKMNAPAASAPQSPPPGCGPADTQLLGLRVAPVDTQTLADGTKLTFVKAAGHFEFK